MKRLVAIVLAIVVVTAACGGSDGADSATDPASSADDDTAIAAACEVGATDCDDTGIGNGGDAGGTPNTIVDGEHNGIGPDGLPIEGGLTVPEALSSDATGMVAVQGFVVASGETVELCELLAESFPPQCGGASVTLDVTDVADLRVLEPVPYSEEQGVTWTDSYVTLFGNIVDGIFVVA